MELAGNTFAATFVDGLVMDGGSDFLKGKRVVPRAVFFNSAAPFDLSGTGQFVYPAAGSSTFSNTSARLTIARASPSAGRRTARLQQLGRAARDDHFRGAQHAFLGGIGTAGMRSPTAGASAY